MSRFTEEVRNVVQLSSVSRSGNEELANYLAGLMRERGFKISLQQVMHSLEGVSNRQFNLIGVLGNPLVERKIKKGLLLLSHLDTGESGRPENWSETGGNPYAMAAKDDRFYGLGTADAKVDFLCKLQATQRFREKKLKMPIYLVGTCGSETGMYGVKYLIQSLAVNPKYVLVGFPSGLDLVHEHKSAYPFRTSIRYHVVDRDAKGFNRRVNLFVNSKGGPAALPDDSRNAVIQLLDFIRQANSSGFETRLTRISGGDASNQIPESASAEFYLTSHQFEDFKRFFKDVTQRMGMADSFRIELGGLGDTGIGFLPDNLFECICELREFTRSIVRDLSEANDKGYELPSATVNVSSLAQSPNLSSLYFDVRTLPGSRSAEIRKKVTDGISKLASRYPALNLTVEMESASPELSVPDESEWLGICRETLESSGIDARLKKSSLCSEAGFFAAKGYDVLGFGPGDVSHNLRTSNEFIRLEDIQKATLFYEQLIERVCL